VPEIQTLPKPDVAPAPAFAGATSVNALEVPLETPTASVLVLEGLTREITVSDREPMMSEEDVYWKYGVNLGRMVGKYELPYAADESREADHTIFIFDDSNPEAKHASSEKQFTIISRRALEEMGSSNLERRGDAYKNRDIIQIGEGQKLEVGRKGRWLPRETREALKHEKRRVISDDQAEFYVENGELKLKTNGHNGGFFLGVPSNRERALKQARRDAEKEMGERINASKPTQHSAVLDSRHTAREMHMNDAYVNTELHPAKPSRRHAIHLGAVLRRRRTANNNPTTMSHNLQGLRHKYGR
jgi:hypothetical protein